MIQITTKKKDGIWFSVAVNDKQKMTACSFSDGSGRRAEESVMRTIRGGKIQHSPEGSAARFKEIYRIYKGERVTTNMNSLDMSQITKFQRRVYLLLHRIPRGRITTYGAIAERLGGQRFARAVGGAVASNPFPLVIPCHRVLPSSLRVGNYGMPGRDPSEGGYVKRGLLEREGVTFRGDRVSANSIWKP